MAYNSETDKIDKQTTDGLAGTGNSLAYRVHEIEKHFHNWESWFGVAASPSGETHVADRIAPGINPFQVDAGNDTWGSWLQILGSSDTPARTSMAKYDAHRLLPVAIENDSAVHVIQIGLGDSGAAALSAGDYTEFAWYPAGGFLTAADLSPIEFMCARKDDGTKAWIRMWVDGENTSTMDFYFGIHEYAG